MRGVGYFGLMNLLSAVMKQNDYMKQDMLCHSSGNYGNAHFKKIASSRKGRGKKSNIKRKR